MTDTERPAVSKAYSWYIFSLLFLLYMFDYVDRMIVASLFPFLQSDWGLTDKQCGMLVSAVYWSIIIFTLPVSVLIDRWSRKKSIAIMALIWSIATGICAFTRGFNQLFTARIAIGIGEAGYAPGGTAMISALFPQEKRAQVMGLWNASIPLGGAIGVALGGIVAAHWGWRHAFGLVAIPGAIIALLFFWVRDYKTVELISENKADGSGRMSTFELLGKVARTPSLLLTYLGFAGNTFVTTALITWLPTYFHRTEGLAMDKAGMKGGAVMLLAMVGAPLGGYLADRLYRFDKRARLWWAAGSSMLTGLLLYLAFSYFEGTRQYIMLLGVGVSVASFLPAAAAVTQDVVHPGIRAFSYSLCVIVQNLLGSSLGPIFVGSISDAKGIHFALAQLSHFCVIAGLLFIAGSLFYRRDLENVDKVPIVFEGKS